MGPVSLTVAGLARALAFYQTVLGLGQVPAGAGRAWLAAADGKALVELVELPGARPKPPRSTGLYHFALLLPARRDLARWLGHLAETGWPLQGASDHLVSEAIYLADPDGNGIEVYVDRPRAQWPRAGGQIQMAVDPLDVHGLMGELVGEDAPWAGLPAGAIIGHVHLQVADLDAARAFYCDLLGFDLVSQYGGRALFVSAGGYHHHLGLNVWAGRGAPPAPEGSAGLRYLTVVLPDRAGLDAVTARLHRAGVSLQTVQSGVELRDPSHNRIRLVAESQGAFAWEGHLD